MTGIREIAGYNLFVFPGWSAVFFFLSGPAMNLADILCHYLLHCLLEGPCNNFMLIKPLCQSQLFWYSILPDIEMHCA